MPSKNCFFFVTIQINYVPNEQNMLKSFLQSTLRFYIGTFALNFERTHFQCRATQQSRSFIYAPNEDYKYVFAVLNEVNDFFK